MLLAQQPGKDADRLWADTLADTVGLADELIDAKGPFVGRISLKIAYRPLIGEQNIAFDAVVIAVMLGDFCQRVVAIIPPRFDMGRLQPDQQHRKVVGYHRAKGIRHGNIVARRAA